MAKEKKAKQPKPVDKKQPKGMRGKLPTKRSINLVVVNENKINPLYAILGILVILALATAFGKFLVYDRIAAVSRASARASTMGDNLDKAHETLEAFGDVETTYAHYTQEGMTADEKALVDRNRVLALVRSLLSEGNATFGSADFREKLDDACAAAREFGTEAFDPWEMRETLRAIGSSQRNETTVYTWSVTGNTLTVDITGATLEKLNKVARRLEASPIVDSVTISTANKRQNALNDQNVAARLIVYLVQPTKEASNS